MPYIVIEDFRAGLDRRKMAVSAPQGSLQKLSDAHITRGGEIEKRLAFVQTHALPPGMTFGLAGADGQLYTFGSAPTPAIPAGIKYQRLEHPGGHPMTAVACVEFFDGKPAAIGRYANGDAKLFYDGALVTDWNIGSGAFVAGESPNWLLTHKDKLYSIFRSVLGFSAIAEPTRYRDPASDGAFVGFGFKNMSNQSAGSETLTALGRYQDLVAVFSRRNIQIWYLDPDPLQNVQKQTLENIGTFAPKSVVPFGDIDVFFLADSGIRSLRARDSSNQSGVSDVGTPIDEYLLEYASTLTEAERTAAVGVLEPISGRYLLALGKRVYVFSFFQSSKVSAWSTYEPGAQFTDFVVLDGKVWSRAGDDVFLLGGASGKEYGSYEVEVDLPYIDGRQIATFKKFTAIDIVSEGEWQAFLSTDPNQPEAEAEVAIMQNSTINLDTIGMIGKSPVIKLRLVSKGGGAARLSKVVVHYNVAEAS